MSGEPESGTSAEESKSWHQRAWAWLVPAALVTAAWIAFVSDLFGIHDHFFPPGNSGAVTPSGNSGNGAATPSFTEPLTTAPGPGDFRAFLKANDDRVVRLDTSCLPPGNGAWIGCRWHAGDLPAQVGKENGNRETLVEITSDTTCDIDHAALFCKNDPTLLEFEVSNTTSAEVDNGKYGADNLVFQGYFVVHYGVGFGDLPPYLLAIRLTAVNPTVQ
jgi:hypothetical protein